MVSDGNYSTAANVSGSWLQWKEANCVLVGGCKQRFLVGGTRQGSGIRVANIVTNILHYLQIPKYYDRATSKGSPASSSIRMQLSPYFIW